MLRHLLILGFALVWSASFKQGCEDVTKSVTHLPYYPIRDMRQTVVLDPQRGDPLNLKYPASREPDSLSVATHGGDRYWQAGAPYDDASARLTNPVPATEASVAHGDSLYHQVCWTCHGKTMTGDGPVAQYFMQPPDLLAEATRLRKDGYLYSYMRHGGIVMPSYGNALSSHDAWDIINYLRSMMASSPR